MNTTKDLVAQVRQWRVEAFVFEVLLRLMLLCILCTQAPSASALTITSEAPGNIFVAGSAIRLAVKDAQGSATYEILDYFGRKLASGPAAPTIELPALKPGWYEIKCRESSHEVYTTIGVVIDRGNAPLPDDGRVCTDVAAGWLVKQDAFGRLAQMIRMAGIPWVRERLRWRDVESERGRFDWANYQTLADTYSAEGIRVYQIWHDSPQWTRPHTRDSECPDDLRDVYRFTRTAASQFAHRIRAWEIWNEPDGNGWPSDRYASVLKAAYLGTKDGNPRAMVLLGSLSLGVTMFEKGICACGITDYFDVINWHTYGRPSTYRAALASHLDLLGKYGAAGRPVWLTEAGTHLRGTEGPDGTLLSSENQRLQCRFVPRSVAMSLAAGTDKHFFFVLPSYMEGDWQFGALRPDLTPYPAFLSLSAAANILGQSAYIGEYETGSKAIVAQAFSTPMGNVLVAWSDIESEMIVPTDRRTVRAANIFGEESVLTSRHGVLRVKVGPDAVYLLDVGGLVEKRLAGKPRGRGRLPRLNPSRIIAAGSPDLPFDRNSAAYTLNSASSFDYGVQVYNFNAESPANGTVEVVPPAGWAVENARRSVSLNAMGRQALTFRVRPGAPDMNRAELIVRARFGDERVAPCVSGFRFDPASITPVGRKPLDWARDSARWQGSASSNGTLALSNPERGVLRFDVTFNSTSDRWAYPVLKFEKPMDLSGFDGLAFDLNVQQGDPASAVRVMLVESNGSHYTAMTPAAAGKRRVVFPFPDTALLGLMGPDPNGRLDLHAIAEVKIGCNVASWAPGKLVIEISGLELVKLRKPQSKS